MIKKSSSEVKKYCGRNMKDQLKKYLPTRKLVFLIFSISMIITLSQIQYLNRSDYKYSIQYTDHIDIVYTWVNGSDEKFIETIQEYTGKISTARFDNKNELKYSLRSLEKYAPWVRHVYIVTNGQIPSWLNLEYEKVSIVPHDQLMKEPGVLPTFSSNVIEQFLHYIPNLSKRFLYLNDDIFLGSHLYPEDLYTPSSGIHVYTGTLAPNCAPFCPWSRLKDGICDKYCNVEECEFDCGDCVPGNEDRMATQENGPTAFQRTLITAGKMLNLAYGLKQRYTLPHNGHLFDTDIMEAMFEKFRKEFNETRYNRFRTPNDIPVAHSFFHYLMSEMRDASPDEVFDHFDLDKSGIWSDKEMRKLLIRMDLVSINTPKTNEQFLDELLISCFNTSSDMMNVDDMNNAFDKNTNFLKVTKDLVTNCPPLSEILVKRFPKQQKYQFRVTSGKKSMNNFMFLTNITEVKISLDKIRKNPKIYNCIGDKMVPGRTEKDWLTVLELLDDFYREFFPHPSKFELPVFAINRFRYYDDYLRWKTRQKSIFISILGVLFIICILICCLKSKYSRQ